MDFQRHTQYAETPLISECELILDETSKRQVEKLRNTMFYVQVNDWPSSEGSDIQKWFRKVSSGGTAARSWGNNKRQYSRLISWKKDKKFDAENLFFRTVDTSRVLPMSLADFQINWYTNKAIWDRFDSVRKNPDTGLGGREGWQTITLMCLMWHLLVMRNMHDYGGADIPIIVTEWKQEQMDMALDYWVELSQDKWSAEEKRQKFFEMDRKLCHCNPCFYQTDLLLRSLLSDPAAEYVPRFIIVISTHPDIKARALFTEPAYVPPEALVASFPTGCGNADCEDKDCGMFDFKKCWALKAGSSMVRRDKFPRPGGVKCNLWICNVEEEPGYTGPSKFQKCHKCKETLYCCRDHQICDWDSHKRICEVQRV